VSLQQPPVLLSFQWQQQLHQHYQRRRAERPQHWQLEQLLPPEQQQERRREWHLLTLLQTGLQLPLPLLFQAQLLHLLQQRQQQQQ
jgi:hypothetical protein